MKALSLTQPWASLVAVGEKTVETRSWGTRYRGMLAIHASKNFPRDCRQMAYFQEPFRTALVRNHLIPSQCFGMTKEALPCGVLVATCLLVDVIKTEDISKVMPRAEFERAFGDYTPGRFAWLLMNINALSEPIAVRGALGLWEVENPYGH